MEKKNLYKNIKEPYQQAIYCKTTLYRQQHQQLQQLQLHQLLQQLLLHPQQQQQQLQQQKHQRKFLHQQLH